MYPPLAAHALLWTSVIAGVTGCQPATDAPPLGQGQLQLTSDVLADTDVARMMYAAAQVDCVTGAPAVPAVGVTAVESLVDAFQLEGAARHLFADRYFWLPEGCYDVHVLPLNAAGEPSADCAPARRAGVAVGDGQTTEIRLISQCGSAARGGPNEGARVNHAPQIVDLAYAPSKFVCVGEVLEVCLSVLDPDNDPLRFVIDLVDGARRLGSTQSVTAHDTTVYCARFAFAQPGEFAFDAVVHDMGWDADGAPVTLESQLEAAGDLRPSSDRIHFVVHALGECP